LVRNWCGNHFRIQKTVANKGVLKYMKLGIGTRRPDFIGQYSSIYLYITPQCTGFPNYTAHKTPCHSIKLNAAVV